MKSLEHPRLTETLFGHKTQQQFILEQIEQGKMHHALLLVGPKGVGKATFAYHLARRILKGEGGFHVPGTDPVCKRIKAESHGDLIVVERGLNDAGKPQQEIALHLVRSVVQFLQETPLEGGWRVVILDDAEYLGIKAANTLLKKLEEPPKKTLLIIVTSQEQKLLPTIRSRCQRLLFSPLDDEAMMRFLREYRIEVTPDLQAFAMGCPGRALALQALGGSKFTNEFKNVLVSLSAQKTESLAQFVEAYTAFNADSDFDPYPYVGMYLSWWLGEAVKAKLSGIDLLPTLSKKTVSALEAHYHHINHSLNHIESADLDRKAVLASLFLQLAA